MSQGALLFLALKVSSPPGLGCPDEHAFAQRLEALGVATRDDVAIHVRFSTEDGKRAVVVEMPDTAPRRLQDDGATCDTLAEATIALLSVLLDDDRAAVKTETRPMPASVVPETTETTETTEEAWSSLRFDAAAILSTGIVAPFAGGASFGAAYRPLHWGSLGIVAETWPERENALDEGRVTLGAASLGMATCAGPRWRRLSVEGCLLAHGGVYSLSAIGVPVVEPAKRGFFGLETDLRGAVAITRSVGLFVRMGVWIPFTRLDVTIQGVPSTFGTTSIGPKASLGLELNL